MAACAFNTCDALDYFVGLDFAARCLDTVLVLVLFAKSTILVKCNFCETLAQARQHFCKASDKGPIVPLASRLVLLPSLLVALAFAMFCAPSFVFGGRPASTTSLRSSTARAAVPEVLELQTSVTTALEVSTPGWWANIVTLVLPIAILLVLYLQSEKRKYNEKMGIK